MKKTLKPISKEAFADMSQRGMNQAAKNAPKNLEWSTEAKKRWQEIQRDALRDRKAYENNQD